MQLVKSWHGNASKDGPGVPATDLPYLQSFPGLNVSALPFYSFSHPTNISEHTVCAGHCPKSSDRAISKNDNVPALMEYAV